MIYSNTAVSLFVTGFHGSVRLAFEPRVLVFMKYFFGLKNNAIASKKGYDRRHRWPMDSLDRGLCQILLANLMLDNLNVFSVHLDEFPLRLHIQVVESRK